MLALGEEKVGEYIRTIGLWRNKAKNVILLSEALIRDYGGEVPGDRDELMKLPGVGRKTANVVLNMAFGQPTMAVDTIYCALATASGLHRARRRKRWRPFWFGSSRVNICFAHRWLILHGRYVRKARKPECEKCVIADLCKYPARPAISPPRSCRWRQRISSKAISHFCWISNYRFLSLVSRWPCADAPSSWRQKAASAG